MKRLVAIALLLLTVGGCSMARLHRDLSEANKLGTVSGPVVTPDGSTENVIVALFRKSGKEWVMQDADRLSAAVGSYVFMLEASAKYRIVGFQDLDGDLEADPDEPSGVDGLPDAIAVKAGERLHDRRLRLSAEHDLDRLGLELDGLRQASFDSIPIAAGEVVSLDDPRFSAEQSSAGMWSPLTAAREVGGGVYFLEPHRPGRIPVVFVHGIGGSPRDFEHLIEGLDRSRFEPWLCHYPSGVRLERATTLLAQLLVSMRRQLGVERGFLVAHSMGGLVARSILTHIESPADRAILELFVTLSTPWSGHKAAAKGVRYAPAVVPAWHDVEPGSEFIEGLRAELEPEPEHHLFFSFLTRNRPLMLYSHDTVVSVASQLDPWFQHRAARTYGYNLDHIGILFDADVAKTFYGILTRAADGGDLRAGDAGSRDRS